MCNAYASVLLCILSRFQMAERKYIFRQGHAESKLYDSALLEGNEIVLLQFTIALSSLIRVTAVFFLSIFLSDLYQKE